MVSHHHASGATGAGSVVLELGGDVGVLVLTAPASLLGHEIDISPVDDGPVDEDTGTRTHSLVRERVTAGGTSYAAVYAGVPAGRYTVWRDAGTPSGTVTPAGTVTITGGQVTCFTLG
jgi:hypothetical protein